MSAVAKAARHIAQATGRGLTMFAAQSWHSATFDGQRMLLEFDGDLPPNVEQIDFPIPGFVLIDFAQITARRAEAVVVTVQ